MSFYSSPLTYPGGKSCLFPFISNFFYENGLIGINYAEPYAGGAGLALRLLFDEYVEHIYINDFDKAIYSFWSAVINRSDEFCHWIAEVEISIKTWEYFRDVYRKGGEHDYFELAKAAFFLNRTNVSGILKGGVIGGMKQNGIYKVDARFKKDDLIEKIQKISRFKHRISLSNDDGLVFIQKMNRRNEEVFIYLDPPYFKKSKNLYMNSYSESDHQKLSEYMHKIRNRWMVSYDNHDFILNLYTENNKVLYKLSQNASNRVGTEVLIFANNLLYNNSVKSLNSAVLL